MIDENLTNKPKSALSAEERVRIFQRKLYSKAKQEKKFKFYVLYDKLSIPYFLQEAWRRVKSGFQSIFWVKGNRGKAG